MSFDCCGFYVKNVYFCKELRFIELEFIEWVRGYVFLLSFCEDICLNYSLKIIDLGFLRLYFWVNS